MPVLRLVGNYIDWTDFLVDGGDVGYGHLQLVKVDGLSQLELEGQAPDNPLTIELGGTFNFPSLRDHTTSPYFADPDNYKYVDIAIPEGRAFDSIWNVLLDVHMQFVEFYQNVDYSIGQNSNAYINTLLSIVDLDINNYIEAATPLTVGEFPSFERNILTDQIGPGPTISLDLSGSDENDLFYLGDGNDTISGGAGDDTIHGGNGSDIAKFEGSIADYQFTRYSDGSVEIGHISGDRSQGADRLFEIETASFSSGETVDLTDLSFLPVTPGDGTDPVDPPPSNADFGIVVHYPEFNGAIAEPSSGYYDLLIEVRRDGYSSNAQTIYISTLPGDSNGLYSAASASDGDYEGKSGTTEDILVFGAGAGGSLFRTVRIYADSIDEGQEVFRLMLRDDQQNTSSGALAIQEVFIRPPDQQPVDPDPDPDPDPDLPPPSGNFAGSKDNGYRHDLPNGDDSSSNPDYALTFANLSTGTLRFDEEFTIDVGYFNGGGGERGQSEIGFYLSTDTRFGDNDDIYIGYDGLPRADSGDSGDRFERLTLSDSPFAAEIENGDYYFFAVLDHKFDLDEQDWEDNVSAPIPIVVTNVPEPPPPPAMLSLRYDPLNADFYDQEARYQWFEVVADKPLTTAVDVTWTVAPIGSNPAQLDDFEGGVFPSGTVTVQAGTTARVFGFMPTEDLILEDTEQYQISITISGSDAEIALVGPNGVLEAKIIDSGSVPPLPTEPLISLTNIEVTESVFHPYLHDITVTVQNSGTAEAYRENLSVWLSEDDQVRVGEEMIAGSANALTDPVGAGETRDFTLTVDMSTFDQNGSHFFAYRGNAFIDGFDLANASSALPLPLVPTSITTEADDVVDLTGASNPLGIRGYGGDDIIKLGHKDDVAYGGEGSDSISGGAGNDVLHGEVGDDTLSGGAGEDWLLGGSGDDVVRGGEDNDILQGGLGNDWIYAGTGDDTVRSSEGYDVLHGEGGSDVFQFAGTTLHTAGYVAFNVSSLSQVGTQSRVDLEGFVRVEAVTNGGADADIVELSAEDDAFFLHDAYSGFHYSVSLTADYVGNQSAARFANIEEIRGMGGDDIIDLTSPDYSLAGVVMSIYGGEGNDVLWGSDANETISGGSGDDTMFGGIGIDVLTGNSGADVFEFTRTSTNTSVTDFNIDEGDTLRFYNTGGAEFDATSVALVEDRITISYTDIASGEDHNIFIVLDELTGTLPEILSAIDIIL
jgi:Ca2+-binding RTX toxin-like protein